MSNTSHTSEELANLAVIDSYFATISSGGTSDSIAQFYASDVEQIEFPNALLPAGATRNLQQLSDAAERGRALMQSQTFVVQFRFASGAFVITESAWSGTIAVNAGPFHAGQVLRARFAQVFELRDEKIVKFRNYDCFEPW